MATRVLPDEVIAIMDTTLGEDDVQPYCDSAHVFVDALLASAGLTETILKEIEKWMAAHMVSLSKERQSKEEGAGTAYIKYAGEWAKGLEQTSYGQMAIALDPSGTLSNLSKGKGKAYTFAIPSFS